MLFQNILIDKLMKYGLDKWARVITGELGKQECHEIQQKEMQSPAPIVLSNLL